MGIDIQIRSFVRENFLFGDSKKELKNDQSFLNSGIIDSTGVLELVAFIEDNFQIRIKDEELIPENLDSIERLTQFITRKKETVDVDTGEFAHAFGI